MSKRLGLFARYPELSVIGLVACSALVWGGARMGLFVDAQDAARLSSVVESEELILGHTPRLKKLAAALSNLVFLDYQSRELFAAEIDCDGLQGSTIPQAVHDSEPASLVWPLRDSSQAVARGDFNPWAAFLSEVDYFEHTKFYFIKGEFADGQPDRWKTKVGFAGFARLKDGRFVSVSAKQELLWRINRDAEPLANGAAQAEIESWHQKQFELQVVDQVMFRDVLAEALPDPRTWSTAHDSELRKLILAMASDPEGWEPPYFNFDPASWDMQPGIAVVDIDGDGLDDLFTMPQWGKNQLLRNQGDGTFVDIAPALGLAGYAYASSGLFADFDNDGDEDLLLGRTILDSLMLRNDGGRFVDITDTLEPGTLPKMVSSLSAADYNGDGLLDVYISTYHSHTQHLQKRRNLASANPKALLSEYLPLDQAQHLYELAQKEHRYLNHVGPPNVLLVNKGGRLTRAPQNPVVGRWKNTYHAGWSDYDNDGDPDLYLANDFSPNTMFRNDGAAGFVDVTDHTGTADIGFGMGVSFGDYDNDGKSDLYVTNMYSKAGNRIAGGLGDIVDGEFLKMAGGNTLFRNEGDRFSHVSGVAPPALMVEKAGWGWGSQFCDFDNDGFLDIYALSGFYTAPKEIAVDLDM